MTQHLTEWKKKLIFLENFSRQTASLLMIIITFLRIYRISTRERRALKYSARNVTVGLQCIAGKSFQIKGFRASNVN